MNFIEYNLSNTAISSLTHASTNVETKFHKNIVTLKNTINTLSLMSGSGGGFANKNNTSNGADILAKISNTYSKKEIQELEITPSEEGKVFNATRLVSQFETLGLINDVDVMVNSTANLKLVPNTKNTLKPSAKNSIYVAQNSYSVYINQYQNKIKDALSIMYQINLEGLIYSSLYCQINNLFSTCNNFEVNVEFGYDETLLNRDSSKSKKIPEYFSDLETKNSKFEVNRNKFKTASYYLFNKIVNNTLNSSDSSSNTVKLVLDPNYRDTSAKTSFNAQSLINNLSMNTPVTGHNRTINNTAHSNQNSIEESLQIFEGTLAKHLGSDYIRSVIYSHYGSWLPKYGVYNTNKTEKSTTNAVLANMIDSGDWVSYFQSRHSIDYSSDSRLIRSYIFSRNRYVPPAIGKNYSDLVYWTTKKLQYRPTDSFVSLMTTTLSDQVFHKI
jgi:hypothetical protein